MLYRSAFTILLLPLLFIIDLSVVHSPDPTFNPHNPYQRHRNPVHSEVKPFIHYLKKSMNITAQQCPKKYSRESSYDILIISRSERIILNLDDLMAQLKRSGFVKSRTILLEDYSAQEQMLLMTCADLLIGVQGAGLQWYVQQCSTLVILSHHTVPRQRLKDLTKKQNFKIFSKVIPELISYV